MKKTFDKNGLVEVAKDLIIKVGQARNEEATILALSGELGAGKTTLTKEIGRLFGVKGIMISPTFVIMKTYKTKHIKFKNLIHIDAYRLDKSEELLNLGWEVIIKNKDNLIIIEWPERVEECLPTNVYRINLEHKNDTTRTIKF